MLNRRVAVIGAAGQLGQDVAAAFRAAGDDVAALTRADLDITRDAALRSVLEALRSELIINAAAWADVEGCERDPARAHGVNALPVADLARTASVLGARLFQVSTDYVFDGEKGEAYVESDAVRPVSAYGNSKASGEFYALAHAADALVVRVSGLYGHHPCRSKGGLNFVERMLDLAREGGIVSVVTDERVSPTPTAAVARQLVALSRTPARGIVHVAAEGGCSWYEFAAAIFEEAGVDVSLQPASAADFPSVVRRPKNSVLASERLAELGLAPLPHWRTGLHEYFAARVPA